MAKVPATAVAAATTGETRWVRPPRPWRPSKLRFEVDAQRSPTASLSGFMARHMEQPGSRHSKPAAVKILSSPSASAWAFTRCEPGTTRARNPVRTCPSLEHGGGGPEVLDARVGARAHEDGVDADLPQRRPGLESHVGERAPGRLPVAGVGQGVGIGDGPVMGATWAGLVPQVTWGTMVAASSATSLSKVAPSSVGSVRQ